LTNLQTLNLSGNNLTTIPTAIASLTNLTKLDLTGNKLTKIPSAITNLSTLNYLNLRANKITNIPDAIANLSNLTKLYLSGNQIAMIPAAIANLINLTTLDLINNDIGVIPKAIASLPKLTILRLQKNPIYKPTPEIVNQGLTGIREYYQINNNKTVNLTPNEENNQEESKINKPKRKKGIKSSWANGLFYLFMFVVVIGLIGYFAGKLPPLNLLIVVMSGILFIPIIGILQLRNDEQLSDQSFTEVMIKVIEQLPVVGDIIGKILPDNKSNEEE
jgi:Leucine rich repeat/Leucine Rich Repeat